MPVNNKGKNNPMYGKKHSAETKEKIRQKALQRFINPENHPSWAGGKRVTTAGYIEIRMSTHHSKIS